MKRQMFGILAILCFLTKPVSSQSSGDFLPLFYEVWEDSKFGADLKFTEAAGWILQNPEGTYELRKWPKSGNFKTAS